MGQVHIAKLSREEWLRERQKGIGSSEIAAVLGLNPYQSPLDVYNSKVMDPMAHADQHDTKKTRAGIMMEPVIANLFMQETGYRTVQDNKIRFNDSFPILRANIDRMILRTDDGKKFHHETPGVLEMKNTERATIAKWEEDSAGVKELPLYVWCQIQHQLFCTGWEWGFVYFLISGYDTMPFHVEPNESFVKDMMEEAQRFWSANVLAGKPPEPRTADEVRKLFPTSMQDKAVEASEALYDIHLEAYALHEELKEKSKNLDALKDKITVAMGPSEILTHNGSVVATFKTALALNEQKFKEENPDQYILYRSEKVNTTALKEKNPLLHKKYSEKIGSRKFLFK